GAIAAVVAYDDGQVELFANGSGELAHAAEHETAVARHEQCRAPARGFCCAEGRRQAQADRGEADRVDIVARVAHLDQWPGTDQEASSVADVDAILREGLVARLQR